MLTSHLISDDHRRSGFSLIEILVVLAIFALSTAIIIPNTSRMMDQATAHAVFFDFQKQISDLRREANRTGIQIRVTDPSSSVLNDDNESGTRQVVLKTPWTYTMAPPLDVEAGGHCSASSVNLVKGERVVMMLRTDSGDCRFINLQTRAARLP